MDIKKLDNMDGIGDRLEARSASRPRTTCASQLSHTVTPHWCRRSQQLWMSYNPIDKLTGIEKLRNLQVLFMGNCKVCGMSRPNPI